MSNYKHVLIALDLSDGYEQIVERAFSLAAEAEKVSLIYVQEPIIYPDAIIASAPVLIKEQMIEYAQQVFREIGEKHALTGEQYIENGRAATEIHKVAEANEVDLVVVGSHGRHGVQLILGSTANAVLHGATCDVLAVRIGKM
ncbi:MAG: universal stress protein [Pseudomonadales bacterium]